MPKKLVTMQVAADAYGLSVRTIRSYVAQGLITGYRMPGGRAIRVEMNEIDRAITTIPTVGTIAGPEGRS
ncbi:helix-turn-helix domain-containing protein [Raineyella fluvialis]|uniref:Helix-turn-helix domain-containing protein n=1 Tax=Raineyella fluvialis TaxID=2662261 RepID=A0A5Q2FCK4_9ACTN|nr:helix-turn-helix domain-containing protein [Raineyella fluvialis]